MNADLFTHNPYKPDPYPATPGYKDRDTSRKAAESMVGPADQLRARCMIEINSAGLHGRTADETAERIGETVLSVRPRFTELQRMGKIVDSGARRHNSSGRSAKVWIAV